MNTGFQSFNGLDLYACLTGGRTRLKMIDDKKLHRANTEWRVMKFSDGNGKRYLVEYSVREADGGKWEPFGGPLKRHNCQETI